MPTTRAPKSNVKKGGNLAKSVNSLMVPFGLILAKNSLERFLKTESKKSSPSPRKRVSLAGGMNVAANAMPLEGGKKHMMPKKNVHQRPKSARK